MSYRAANANLLIIFKHFSSLPSLFEPSDQANQFLHHSMQIETEGCPDELSITENELQKTMQFEMDTQKLPYRDDNMYVDFSMDCPLSVSQIVIDNSSLFTKYMFSLNGNYLFEAGFDIIPAHCKLALPEQSYCFQGI